jgi:hypothetical protein
MTWRDRLPVGLSIASLMLAVLGLTPAGEAASRLVRVQFAERTEAVSGISASRTPQAGQLLALDSRGRFPAAAIPRLPSAMGPAGPVGEAGPTGLAGLDGGQAISVREGPWPGEVGGDDVPAATLKDMPPGPSVLLATVELASDDPVGAAQVFCWLQHRITRLGNGAATVGMAPGGTTRATLGIVGAHTGTPGDIELICRNFGGGSAVKLNSASITALRVLDIRVFQNG